MAVDEAILKEIASGGNPPTLRLYGWEPTCLSLGYAQPWRDINIGNLGDLGWNIVRRPTGGRAILHKDELTYAVIAPASEPRLQGSVIESYKYLSKALLQALGQLGASAQAAVFNKNANDQRTHNPVCFEVPSNYEITVKGKKLIGSAQARRREGILQHGSLPLFGDITEILNVLSFSTTKDKTEASDRLSQRATSLESVLRRKVTWEEAAHEFIIAFQDVLNLELEPGELSISEKKRATELENDKYRSPDWTRRI
ncbi:MAG: lipoate--protein ligase family protein [Anaerolineales bacterium]|nr:lipoate--protein ligase family protein [Anaerolineales bacterium]